MDKKIVIIDGNSLINRAYYAVQRPMITREGIYTQGVYGFINMLNKIEADYSPEYLTVAFDLKAPTFRHLEYEDYKAGRKAMPAELVMQMPLIKEVLRGMNIRILELEGYEADDIIGTVARTAEIYGIEPLIITGDKDALQLVTENTKVLITKRGITDFEIYDPEKMKERYGLTPAQFIDLKGLMGDSSDNIPGIPGVGEKTGIKLLEQFGSVEALLARTEEISSGKLRTKVEENAQLAVMSKRLATINTNVPIEFDMEEFKLTEPDYEALIKIYTRLEFNSFLKKMKLPASTANKEKAAFKELEVSREIVENASSVKDKLSCLKGEVYVKVFSDISHIEPPYIEGAFFMDDSSAFYVDSESVPVAEITDILNELGLSFIGHEIKDDMYCLMGQGLKNFRIVFDTAVAEYVLEPTKSSYDLKNMVLEKLHSDIDTEQEALSGGQLDFFEDNRKKLLDKGVKLGSAVKTLRKLQQQKLEEENLVKVFEEAELPLIEVMASMEIEGIKVSGQFLEEFGSELKDRISELEEQIYAQAGCEFNINSPFQLGNVLFENLKLTPAGKKTKRGYSTSADVLEKIKDKHPIVNSVLVYRNLTKLNSTYVEGMKPLICSDGKIRAHFRQTVTATGRISCTEPNLQNIPIRQELGRTLRRAFTADDGHVLIGADYSQIELRVLAHLSGDDDLIKAFNNGDDIHKATASRVLGVPFDKVTPQERSRAKAVNFGVIYGMSGFGLSEELNISRKEAEKYIQEYFAKHRKVKEYMDSQISLCRERGYSETILGRKRPIHEINAASYMVRQLGERLAMNSPIQGSAADIIKLAMIKVYGRLKESFPDTKLILQVHDELILCAPAKDKEAVKELLRESMETAASLSVKLIADVNEGYSWYDLK